MANDAATLAEICFGLQTINRPEQSGRKRRNNGRKHIYVWKLPQFGTISIRRGLTVLLLFWVEAGPDRPLQFMFAQTALWIVEMKRGQPPLPCFISLPLKNRYAPYQKNSLLSEICITDCQFRFQH